MNSIDTCATGKPLAVDSADAELQPGVASDPIALAALLQLTAKVDPGKPGTNPLALAAMIQTGTDSGNLPDIPQDPGSQQAIGHLVSQMASGSTGPEVAALAQQLGAMVKGGISQTTGKENVPQQPPAFVSPEDTATSADSDVFQPKEAIGDDILQSLNAQSSQQPPVNVVHAPTEAAPVVRVDQAARIETFVSQIADRILVTDPLGGQNAQVHIKIADAVLPGTELQLWRGDGGQLNVNFATTSPHSAQILADASQLLAQRLNERLALSMPVIVSVQNGDSEMPQDGRSRQYQSVYDMLAAQQQSA
jgi:type III secretion system needle length determinant